MASLRDARAAAVLALLVFTAACDRRDASRDDAATAPLGDTTRALEVADPELTSACDSLATWLRSAMGAETEATYGRFTGSVRGVPRYGCRFTAADTLDVDAPQRPLDVVRQALVEQGWTADDAYSAEGPEGRMAGLRRASLLCVLQHYWDVGSDDERAEQWVAPARYEVSVECFREAPRQPER